MKFESKLTAVLFGSCLLASIGCRPPPTSQEIQETPEGKPCGPEGLVDNGEDGNNQVVVQDGRSGYIYTYVDETGSTIEPTAGSQGGVFTMTSGGYNSQMAMHMKGKISGANVVFAGMGMNLTDPKDLYDASKYGGVSFWAKRGPGSTGRMRFKIPDVNTDPAGGVCGACYNDFGVDLNLTEDWQKYTIVFDSMRQESGWGNPRPRGLDVEKIYAIQFHVNQKGADYDIWVDDVQFTGCQ